MPLLLEEHFAEGSDCLCRDQFNTWRPAVILVKRGNENSKTEVFVHFLNKDRRWDRWTTIDQLRLPKSVNKGRRKADDDSPSQENRKRLRRHSEGTCPLAENFMEKARLMPHEQHEKRTRIKYMDYVHYGEYEMQAWYYSPYPEHYEQLRKLYVCDRCMLYFDTETSYRVHAGLCRTNNPPGRRIYKDGNIVVYELDGEATQTIKLFCQCLCLFAKLFLDHKTIYFDVHEYLFYVLCEMDPQSGGCSPVGYFSKQKNELNHNLSCLLIFPPFLRKGYGQLLIQLSYELSRREAVLAGPEKPLSDLGKKIYLSYWSYKIVSELSQLMDRQTTTISALSQHTGICAEDLLFALDEMKLFMTSNADPGLKCVTVADLEQLRTTVAKQPSKLLNQRCLRWKPKPRELDDALRS